jgi:hypothetical protein
MSESSTDGSHGKAAFTRRRFIIGTVGVSAAAALGGTVVRAPRAVASSPPSGPPTTTLPLPTTTAPEQLLLTWGSDPAREVTVSWNAPLCYANLDVDNAPGVWRDFGNNVARSSAHRPWMPALGNHECEFGVDTMSGPQAARPAGLRRRARRGTTGTARTASATT